MTKLKKKLTFSRYKTNNSIYSKLLTNKQKQIR